MNLKKTKKQKKQIIVINKKIPESNKWKRRLARRIEK